MPYRARYIEAILVLVPPKLSAEFSLKAHLLRSLKNNEVKRNVIFTTGSGMLLCNKNILVAVISKVGGFDQLFRNPPSKPSNVQGDEGLFEAKLILKAITTSSLIPKSKNCHWGKYMMKYLTSPKMTISFY